MKTTLSTLILSLIVSAGMAQTKEWKRAEYIADSVTVKNMTVQHYRDMDSAIMHYYHYYLDYTRLRDSINKANKKGITGTTEAKQNGYSWLNDSTHTIYYQMNRRDTLKCWFKEVAVFPDKIAHNEHDTITFNVSPQEFWTRGYIVKGHNKWYEIKNGQFQYDFLYADRKTIVKNHVIYYIEDK